MGVTQETNELYFFIFEELQYSWMRTLPLWPDITFTTHLKTALQTARLEIEDVILIMGQETIQL